MSDNKETLISFPRCKRECSHKKICPLNFDYEDCTELTQYIAEGIMLKMDSRFTFYVTCLNYKKQ